MNTHTDAIEQRPEQLALPVLPASGPKSVVVPLQFRVSEATARRGLQHVAELRQLLAERQVAREANPRPAPTIRRTAA